MRHWCTSSIKCQISNSFTHELLRAAGYFLLGSCRSKEQCINSGRRMAVWVCRASIRYNGCYSAVTLTSPCRASAPAFAFALPELSLFDVSLPVGVDQDIRTSNQKPVVEFTRDLNLTWNVFRVCSIRYVWQLCSHHLVSSSMRTECKVFKDVQFFSWSSGLISSRYVDLTSHAIDKNCIQKNRREDAINKAQLEAVNRLVIFWWSYECLNIGAHSGI